MVRTSNGDNWIIRLQSVWNIVPRLSDISGWSPQHGESPWTWEEVLGSSYITMPHGALCLSHAGGSPKKILGYLGEYIMNRVCSKFIVVRITFLNPLESSRLPFVPCAKATNYSGLFFRPWWREIFSIYLSGSSIFHFHEPSSAEVSILLPTLYISTETAWGVFRRRQRLYWPLSSQE